jgi:cell division protein FtsB
MVIPAGKNRFGQGIALPWATVESGDSQVPTQWDCPQGEKWFLDPPPGTWEMDDWQAPDEDAADMADLLVEEEEDELPPVAAGEKMGWTLAVLCLGLGLISACVIVPQADANHQLVYQREKLRLDLAQIQNQVAVNKEFLAKMENDPQLIERLAQREMRSVPKGETVLDLKPAGGAAEAGGVSADAQRMSPFTMINLPPPPPLPAYRPVGGMLAELCRQPRSRLYVLGAGMFLAAAGLVLGEGELGKKQV